MIYEAIYEYATIDDPRRRRDTVATTIARVFQASRFQPAQTIAGQFYPATPIPEMADITSPQAAASNDKNFASFLTSVPWAHDNNTRTLPCTALARRPGLIAATGFRWAPHSDCYETLPPTPRLDHLEATADRMDTSCEDTGSITLDVAGEQDGLEAAILLDNMSDWRVYLARLTRTPRAGSQSPPGGKFRPRSPKWQLITFQI